jgi:hypothetical protein
MARNIEGKTLMLGPRDKGLAFTTSVEIRHTLSLVETIQLDGMPFTGIKTTHGQLVLKV